MIVLIKIIINDAVHSNIFEKIYLEAFWRVCPDSDIIFCDSDGIKIRSVSSSLSQITKGVN